MSGVSRVRKVSGMGDVIKGSEIGRSGSRVSEER